MNYLKNLQMEVDVPLVGTVSMVKRTARVAQQKEKRSLLHGVELPDQVFPAQYLKLTYF